MKYAVNARHVPEALGSSSQGTTAGRFIFVSGQLPVEEHDNEKLVGDDVAQQVERELDITANILSTIDLTLTDVAQTTVYLTDLNDFEAMDRVYAKRFGRPAPARSVVEVQKLPLNARVEIACIACR